MNEHSERIDIHHSFSQAQFEDILDLIRHVSGGSDVRQTLAKILSNTEKIMSAISDFAAKQTVHNDKIDAAVTGLTADVADLNAQIAALQATQGAITAEDQALLDGIDARAQGISDKLEALDALTPPVFTSPPTPGA